ncbi:MAG: hypothetical protein EGP90_05750 [Bacteroides sp.]|uniref:Uncharacterized protein n=5 Tax=Bacteroides TaxID=816 RepID=A0A1V0QDB2_9BACE|nr:hypothetical protein A4V03_20780 [Bacteroides caecimuris]EEO54562.1 hypothetical protein BSCG_01487 [Bacteroides sp. 2_2_4]EEZ05851.1 hypothetical protein HMPREF0102_00851 [Bacteroides sp. 2_1_22]KAA3914710.1 hypothetical protein F3F42_00720 [Bacteroides ovatus]KAA9035555.1 hypothetical protein F6S82_25945 [Bacteroides xylanisolvens]KAB4179066.1 hypothetical protein GAQ34_22935 [Bacteroides uniformis]MBE5694051.1 hypothetical protein [Bacteroides sp.]RJU26422.1 hypothetical protein DXA05_
MIYYLNGTKIGFFCGKWNSFFYLCFSRNLQILFLSLWMMLENSIFICCKFLNRKLYVDFWKYYSCF